VAEWLRSGLQSRVHRFDSGRRLFRLARKATLFGFPGDSRALERVRSVSRELGADRLRQQRRIARAGRVADVAPPTKRG
jgi:hypothetical protein